MDRDIYDDDEDEDIDDRLTFCLVNYVKLPEHRDKKKRDDKWNDINNNNKANRIRTWLSFFVAAPAITAQTSRLTHEDVCVSDDTHLNQCWNSIQSTIYTNRKTIVMYVR